MKFSERDEELRLLVRLYAGTARGRGAVVFTNGPVGCGKTALLQAFASRVKEQGGHFLSVTASTSERFHLYGLIDQLVNAIRAAGLTADPFAAEEVDVTVDVGDHQRPPRIPLGLLQRVSRTISELAAQGPLVLGVDDVHFADEPSLQCLRYLIRRIDSSAVLIVMNESSCHERELATLHAETLHLPYCHRIRLAPLTVSGTADQLTRRLGIVPTIRTAESWSDVSGGNPLLLNALVEDYLIEEQLAAGDDGPVRGTPEPGESFRHAFLRCLHRCEPSMLAAARALAVLGDSASPALVGDFLGVDATSVRRCLADLNAAGLLIDLRFRHERARQAVLDGIPPDGLLTMHGRAAELLHASGAPARAVADQLMATHASVKAPWRVGILREAAREALHAGEIGHTVDYLRHASAICEGAVEEAHIAAALADAQWLIDPVKAGRYLPHLSALVTSGTLTGDDAMVPVKHLMWRGDFARADDLLGIIESGSGHVPAGSPWAVAPVDAKIGRLWLSFVCPGLSQDVQAAAAARPAPPAPRPRRPVSLSTLLNVSATLDGDGEEFQGADHVLRRTDADSPLTPALFALLFLIQNHRSDEAVQWSDRLLREPWIRHVPMRRAMFETIRSAAALRGGDPVTAGESARTALELVTAAAWGVAVGLPLALAVRAATEQRDFDAVTPYLNTAVPPVMFDTPFALPYLQALGRYHLAMGRPHTALSNFQSCGDLMRQWGADSPDLADWRKDAVAALVAMRRAGQARTLLEEQLTLLGDGRSRDRGVALRRLAAISAAPDRQSLLKEAIRILADCGDEFELGRARSAMAAATVPERPATVREGLNGAAGRFPDPGPRAFDFARDIPPAESPGRTSPPAPYSVRNAGQSGTDDESAVPPQLAELTEAERRVGALAVAGCTNREIAVQLFITVSTVEQHLTKIYRKLKVRSRSGLPAELLAFNDLPCFPNGG
ncbi:AAA family ATPase [Streptomyces sp. NPDC014894]|uniref:helix-turn-helix transcriptional regulator n=1 Tax=unclassified Streptomyces TaxID=2593676 RepID=UPI0036F6E246